MVGFTGAAYNRGFAEKSAEPSLLVIELDKNKCSERKKVEISLF
jgi:hypothetical protein